MHIVSTWKVIIIGGMSLAVTACSSHNVSSAGHHAGYAYGTSSAYGATNGWTETRYGTTALSSNCVVTAPCGYYAYPQVAYTHPIPTNITNNYNYPTPETIYTEPEPVILPAPEPTPYVPTIEEPPAYIPPQTYPTASTPDPLPWLPPKK